MKTQELKELTLKIWRYYAEHPEVACNDDLPIEILQALEKENLAHEDIPLCGPPCFTNCLECPLYPCSKSDDRQDGDDEALYEKWRESSLAKNRILLAKKIVEKVEQWEPPKEQLAEHKKIEKWDLVDNAIFDLIEKLNPSPATKIEWTTDGVAETRAEIREVLVRLFCEKLKLCTEEEFYP